jgi:hypothetical protein
VLIVEYASRSIIGTDEAPYRPLSSGTGLRRKFGRLDCAVNDDTGSASTCGQAQGRETGVIADGVPDVLRRGDPDTMPDRQGGRRLIDSLLSWDPWQRAFLRLVEGLQGCWLC